MSTISFHRDVKSALPHARRVVVVATGRRLKRIPKVFGDGLQDSLAALAAAADPGAMGQALSTLTGQDPSTLTLVAVPAKASHHNHPARLATVERLLSGVRSEVDGPTAVVVVPDNPAHLPALLGAVSRAFPTFDARSSSASRDLMLAAVSAQSRALNIDVETQRTIQAARDAARLVDTPPSEMNPKQLAAEAKAIFKSLDGVKVQEIVGDKLVAQGLMGIHSVGRAASEAPRMIVASYTPRRKSAKRVALVGKGITFDTGGLHLKPRGGMEGMKADMGGAAAVLGAFRALVENRCPHAVNLVLCIAENAIGPGAYKPDDIIPMHSGKTVEINNTDAEGRLLLGDGVSWAARELDAEVIIDAATLTGAQLVSTGVHHAAVMSNSSRLESHMVRAGRDSGDLVHPLLFAPELFQPEFKSPVADMRNSVKNRMNAQSSCAGQFIYSHLEGTDVQWAHVDLAGPSFRGERGTGYGVALLHRAVQTLK
jgi:probable aminopeptidase NPEPL1